jgi:hypothetical protein
MIYRAVNPEVYTGFTTIAVWVFYSTFVRKKPDPMDGLMGEIRLGFVCENHNFPTNSTFNRR